MTSVTLINPFARPLHITEWRRPAGNLDYRVTNQFDGPDYLNGGIHRATDVGNTREGEPLKAVANCKARGLRHFDGALGVEMALGNGVTIATWHMDRVDVPATWTNVARGARIGLTGNTGANMPNGQPMPAHTHIRAERDGVPFDVEPYIPMVERAAKPLPLTEDDVQIPAGLSALTFATLAAGNRIRSDPTTIEGSRVLETDEKVQVFGRVDRPDATWTVGEQKGTTWYYIGLKREAGYVATALLPTVDLTLLGADVVNTADPDSALTAQLGRIRTALQGANQAHAAEGSALRAATSEAAT